MDGLQQVGILIGPVLGGLLAVTWGIWLPFTVQGILILAAIIPSFFIVKETMIRNPKPARANESDERERFGDTVRGFLKYPIPVVLAVQFLGNLTRGGIGQGGVLFLYASYAYNADPIVLGSLRSATAIVGLPITFSAGFIMDRFGRKFTLIPSLSLAGTCMMFIAITFFASLPFSTFIVAFVALHLSMSLMTGNMQTLGSDVAPAHARGRFFGVSRMVSQSGTLASPTSFAILSQLVNFGVAFIFLGGAALTGAFIVVFILKETLQKAPRRPRT
jgi:MFS family permease